MGEGPFPNVLASDGRGPPELLGAAVVTVSPDGVVVESQLLGGELGCPWCAGVLGPWGWARPRVVRAGDVRLRVVPRRARCRVCRATQVLLPATLLLRRADVVLVIGRALVLHVGGWAKRGIAALLGVARSTVRGWLARFAARAEVLRAHFTRWALWLEPAWTRLEPHGWPVGDALAALLAAGEAARRGHGSAGVWQFASTATGGRLLCNTSAPFPAPWRR